MEFYEQLGVDPHASSAKIRSAYGQAVSKLTRRRRALLERGGDTAQIDLQRAHLDEAWEVLSDSLRRRRYDAMTRWSEEDHPCTERALWAEVSPDLVHPAAALAAKLLRVTTRLQDMGQLPLAPSGAAEEPPTLVPMDEDRTHPGRASAFLGGGTEASTEVTEKAPPRLAMPRPTPPTPQAAPPRQPVIQMPAPAAVAQVEDPPGPTAEELARLVDTHGFSGKLLRVLRELQGRTIQEVAEQTRISVRYLEAIEAEAFDSLPSATFVRGYVREMARQLRVDPDPVVAGYMRRFQA